LAIIDTHTHVVSSDKDRYPLTPRALSGEWYLDAPHDADALLGLMAAADVDAAVLVQGVGAYSYDNRYALDSAQRLAPSYCGVACIDPLAEGAVETLRHCVGEGGARGVRLMALDRGEGSWLDDPRTFPVWECASDLEIPVVLTVFSHQLPQLRPLLRRFPAVRVALDHCAFPALAPTGVDGAAELFALAEESRVYCKVSTVVLDGASRGGADPAAFVLKLVSVFGARRIMWGSDFCQTHNRPYAELVELARRAFDPLPDDAREACLSGTALELWPELAPALD